MAADLLRLVELRGFEPLTPCMPCRCATNCATAPLPGGQLGNLSQRVCRTRNRPGVVRDSPSRCTTAGEAARWSGSRRGSPSRSCPCPARSPRAPQRPAQEPEHPGPGAPAVEHHDAGLPRRQSLEAVPQRGHHARGQLGDGLVARDGGLLAAGQPGGVLGRVLLGELVPREAGARALVLLPQPLVVHDLEPGGSPRRTPRSRAARRRSLRPQAHGAERGEVRRGGGGLRVTGLVERDVELALGALLEVPRRTPVPEQHQTAAHVTGRSIVGQSRQSRSSA